MTPEAARLDLASLAMSHGEGRRLQLAVRVEPISLSGQIYQVSPDPLPVGLDVSRLAGPGFALSLDLAVTVSGPCMRCLKPASPKYTARLREVDVPGAGEELSSPYVADEVLDLAGWARDAVVLAIPTTILCHEDCPGLCPVCAADLAETGPEHHHERSPDPRWAKLRELGERAG
ncbi:MAG: YceD family protein [Solirubrobacteraceae bacterium]